MSNTTYVLVAAFMAAVLVWQVVSGVSSVVWWWRPRVARRENPGIFWTAIALQLAVLVAFLLTGRSWQLRK
jgi:hypothetical protein